MILKEALIAAALASTGCSSPEELRFSAWFAANGEVVWDLAVPSSAWPSFSQGFPLDWRVLRAENHMHYALYITVDHEISRLKICPDGWMVSDVTLDDEGTHHFRGVCMTHPITT